jgi:hypothetical protein
MTTEGGNRIGLTRAFAAAFALLSAAAPAAAGQARAVLSVSAVVTPGCQIERGDAARPAVACSAETRFSTATVARRDEKPLDEAASILGTPARGTRGIEFAAPVRASAAVYAPEASSTRYLTITY